MFLWTVGLIPSPFYEAWLGVEIFWELYDSTAVFWMFKLRFSRICIHHGGVVAYSYCSKYYIVKMKRFGNKQNAYNYKKSSFVLLTSLR